MTTHDLSTIHQDARAIASALVSDDYQTAIDRTACLLEYVNALVAAAAGPAPVSPAQLGKLAKLTGRSYAHWRTQGLTGGWTGTASHLISELLLVGEVTHEGVTYQRVEDTPSKSKRSPADRARRVKGARAAKRERIMM